MPGLVPDARVGGHLLPVEHVGNTGHQVHLQGQVPPVVSLYLKLEHLEGVLMDTIFVFKLRIYKTYRYFLASNLELKYCSLNTKECCIHLGRGTFLCSDGSEGYFHNWL